MSLDTLELRDFEIFRDVKKAVVYMARSTESGLVGDTNIFGQH